MEDRKDRKPILHVKMPSRARSNIAEAILRTARKNKNYIF